ncbi:hypothetical protein GMORB2_6788 [Geosmithia morbida]|uniref:Vacuolar ATPase assembly protein VMA22 n=1 Tax=Geosmithia morbida TaxID=1094350 RepID=A0A9P4YX12_9HYPO|nr:uncharacterized protein GMORB2_6788 [Geosmithia morbida]KAF4123238.1 hypothetical protein GMORB2_6788 [Geosmithia morbida]
MTDKDHDHDSVIDALLERYLILLDEYTTLRSRLVRLQSSVHQSIARANFSAERGLRYGQDQYDGRMKASRVLEIEGLDGDAAQVPSFKAVKVKEEAEQQQAEGSKQEGEEKEAEEEEDRRKKKNTSNNPLRWFGVLTPMPLRDAQARSIEAVDQVIPQLVSLSAEMSSLEIQVRRARKKRAKAISTATTSTKDDSNSNSNSNSNSQTTIQA